MIYWENNERAIKIHLIFISITTYLSKNTDIFVTGLKQEKMLKNLLTLICVAIVGWSQAQSLQISSSSQVVYGASSLLMHSTAIVTNTNVNPIDVHVMRTVNDTANHHSSYFCWGINCYDTTTSVSFSPETIAGAGGTNSSFIAYLQPNGYNDTSMVTYCFYDDVDQSDSACMTFTYISTPTGIEEYITSGNSLTNAYPNPADNYSKLAYSLVSAKNSKLVLYNVLGSTVKEMKLTNKQNVITIATSELKNGIYFYSLINDGKVISTKKLIVNHR